MTTYLRDKDIIGICEILSAWPRDTKVTWVKLVGNVEHRLGIKTTRQTLQSHVLITTALMKARM